MTWSKNKLQYTYVIIYVSYVFWHAYKGKDCCIGKELDFGN